MNELNNLKTVCLVAILVVVLIVVAMPKGIHKEEWIYSGALALVFAVFLVYVYNSGQVSVGEVKSATPRIRCPGCDYLVIIGGGGEDLWQIEAHNNPLSRDIDITRTDGDAFTCTASERWVSIKFQTEVSGV